MRRLLACVMGVVAGGSSTAAGCGSSAEVALPSADASTPSARTGDAAPLPEGDVIAMAPTWIVEVDSAHPGRVVPTSLLGQYDLAGSLWHYDQNPGLVQGMKSLGFPEWRSSVERWEGRSEMFPTTSDGQACTYPVPTFVPTGWTDFDLMKARDWFIDDGNPVTIDDTMSDARYALDYARSVIDVAAAYGAEPFMSIDAMPRALSRGQTPYRTNCYWTFWNGVTNEPPVDPDVFAAAAVGLVQRLVLGTPGQPGRKVRYFEFWNEPDGAFWDGANDPDRSIFYATAEATLKALARFRASSGHPELRFGFAGFAGVGAAIASIQKFDAMSPPVPLDFLSFHSYDTDPIGVAHDVENVMAAVRATKNYANIEVALTEWGPGQEIEGPGDSRLQPDEAYAHSIAPALHVATALARAASAGLSHADHVFFWDFWPFRIRGLFQNDLETRPQYWAFRMLAATVGNGNAVLPVTSGASDTEVVLATRDPAGHAHVLLVNRNQTDEVVRVNLGGAAASPSEVRVYADPAGAIQEGNATGDTVTAQAQSIVLLDF